VATTVCDCGATVAYADGATSWECVACGRLRALHDGRWVPLNELPVQRDPDARLLSDARDVVLHNCVLLGGCGYPLVVGSSGTVVFREDDTTAVALADSPPVELAREQLLDIDISGPGAVTTGGGFGFFFDDFGSFANGLLTTTVLNWLTTKTSVHTILRLETDEGELFFHYGGQEPAALRISLSRQFMRLKRARLLRSDRR
jgi:hypothetical protein